MTAGGGQAEEGEAVRVRSRQDRVGVPGPWSTTSSMSPLANSPTSRLRPKSLVKSSLRCGCEPGSDHGIRLCSAPDT